MEQLAYLSYGLYLALIAAGALIAVRSPSLVRALMGLIITLFGVAGMYLLMAAPFMALMQILIYVGAVSVLIFFAIMLTKPAASEAGERALLAGHGLRKVGLILSALLPPGILATVLFRSVAPAVPLKEELPLARLGEFLTGPYVLAFELISVVLVAAMVGAVLLGFERRQG